MDLGVDLAQAPDDALFAALPLAVAAGMPGSNCGPANLLVEWKSTFLPLSR